MVHRPQPERRFRYRAKGLISRGIGLGPFIGALHIAFAAGVLASILGAVISLMRGGHRSWDPEGTSEALIRDAESGGAI